MPDVLSWFKSLVFQTLYINGTAHINGTSGAFGTDQAKERYSVALLLSSALLVTVVVVIRATRKFRGARRLRQRKEPWALLGDGSEFVESDDGLWNQTMPGFVVASERRRVLP